MNGTREKRQRVEKAAKQHEEGSEDTMVDCLWNSLDILSIIVEFAVHRPRDLASVSRINKQSQTAMKAASFTCMHVGELGSPVTSDMMAGMCDHLPALQYLDARGVPDDMMTYVSRLTSLTHLDLSECEEMSERGFVELTTLTKLTSLILPIKANKGMM